jgi:hypothetical protein
LAGGQIGQRIGYMLDHFHVQDHIELLARGGHILGRGVAVIDGQSGLLGMKAGDRDIARGRISAHDRRPQPRHGFRQKPAAATDVQNSQALKRPRLCQITVKFSCDLLGDIVQPARVHLVKRFEFAIWVPPFGGHRFKLGDFCRIDGRGSKACGRHFRTPCARVQGGSLWGCNTGS